MSDKTRTLKMLASFGGVAAVLTALIAWPTKVQTGVAETPPETLELTGLIRDFRLAHPDFAVTPANGAGHYADTIAYGMDHRRRPVSSGYGFRVDEQWRDSDGRPIAPHMAGVRGGPGGGGEIDSLGLRVEGKIEMRYDAVVDAFSSSLGAYGLRGNHGGMAYASTNATEKDSVKIHDKSIFRGNLDVGPGADPDEVADIKGTLLGALGTLTTVYPMPDPDAPEDRQSYQAHVHLEGNVTLTGDMFPDDEVDEPAMHFGKLHVKEDSVVTIEGDLTIVVDDELKLKKTQLVVLPDATLTIYVLGKYCEFKDGTIFQTDGHSTTAVMIVALGNHGDVKIEKDSHVYGTIIAPGRTLSIKDGHLYGAFVGGAADLEGKGAGIHVDTQNADQGPWNFAVTVRDKIEIEDDSIVDSFDSNVGPYGETNVGDDALLMTNAIKKDKVKIKDRSIVNGDVLVGAGASPLRVIKLEHDAVINGTRGALFRPNSVPVVAPPILGLTSGDVEFNGGEHTISGDLRCKKLKLEKNTVLLIAGHVTIRCDDKLEMKERSRIELLPASSLTLHVKKEITLEDHCSINMNTGNPQLVSIRRSSLGKKGKIEIKKGSQVCAWIQGAKCELKIEDESEFFGSFAGEKIKVKGDSRLHVDMAYLSSCVEIDDTEGVRGADDTGGITSAETFGQWYRDVLGVNQSAVHVVTLTRGQDGVYEHLSDDFHPIDDRLLGNEGQPHNNHFTFTLGAAFPYTDCAGGFVEFEGGDGFWLFVDGQLVMDVGGVGGATAQYLDLDRLGLAEGEHELFLFFAQRRSSESVFRLRTNLELSTERFRPTVTLQYD